MSAFEQMDEKMLPLLFLVIVDMSRSHHSIPLTIVLLILHSTHVPNDTRSALGENLNLENRKSLLVNKVNECSLLFTIGFSGTMAYLFPPVP